MALAITIDSTDRAERVSFGSLKIENILNSQVDKCSFKVLSPASDPYEPVVGAEIIITNGATRIFGGIIVRVEAAPLSNVLIEYSVECSDYTRLLDQRLVADTYKDLDCEEIIADMVARYAVDFTINNVAAAVAIDYVGFNYLPVSKCLDELAKLLNYDWYVDYNKDIHFFAKETELAPVEVKDDNGTYYKNSLIIRRDNSQIKNSITVRGGEYLGTEFTAEIEANGTDIIFPLGYKYKDFKCTLSGDPLDVGIDYIEEADEHDVLYNFNEKIIRFKESDLPSAGAIIRVSGKPYLPVIVKVRDVDLINTMATLENSTGIYEAVIVDSSINSKDLAIQRANAEIESYARTICDGEFITETDGFRSGQRVHINSTSLGINQWFTINKVVATQMTKEALLYKVSLITTNTINLITLLQNLIVEDNKKLSINENDNIDLVESAGSEVITIGDTFTASIDHNRQTEGMTMNETMTVQSLDYEVEFVAGPQVPSGKKRVFICDGSYL